MKLPARTARWKANFELEDFSLFNKIEWHEERRNAQAQARQPAYPQGGKHDTAPLGQRLDLYGQAAG